VSISFHHVLIALADKPERLRCVFLDLTEKDLKARFLAPYRSGASILLNGEVIHLRHVVNVRVLRTDRNSEIELKELQDRSYAEIEEFNRRSPNVMLVSPGRGYAPEHIVDVGKDVTEDFVKGAPGHSSPFSFFDVINHPWTLTIGGGLLIAFLVWWMGWS
jgi:hypothetical protein